MTRIRAACIHLTLSMLIAGGLLALFWFVWYPAPLFLAVGGHEIFMMLLAVDVVLGPVLTLVVFKTGKRHLKIDLSLIALVQAAALTYGVQTLLAGRPVYIAALGHRFDLIQANEVEKSDLEKANTGLPWFGPIWTGTESPKDQKERENFMFGGADLGSFPQYHAPLTQMRAELIDRSESIVKLKSFNPGLESEIDRWLTQHGRSADSVRFQGLKARGRDMAVVIDARDASVIGIAPFKPWPQ